MCLQVNASTIDGVTPLFNACTVGSVACTEILLENGAQPQSLVHHPSPIHEATSKGILRWNIQNTWLDVSMYQALLAFKSIVNLNVVLY